MASTTAAADPPYKLFYFPVRNLGEPIRMLLNYAGEPFEDVRIPLDEWPEKWKDEMPNGRLPVLELSNGQRLSESHAIMRFLGRKFGLAGSTELEQLRADEVADLHKDFSNEIKQYFYTASGFRQGDQAELLDSVFLPAAGRYFGQLQQLLERNAAQLPFFKKPPSGGPFLTGVMPTFADFLVADNLHSLRGLHSAIFQRFAPLSQFIDRVYGLPKLKDYIQKRAPSMI